jgi:folate-binding protein YgfZ
VTAPSPAADGGYGALRYGAGARVIQRDVLSVSGPEALAYLQGQCSQDLAPLAVGDCVDALLLSPQGKVDALVRVTRTGEESFVLDTDPGCGPAASARLERFKLRTKVTIEELDWSCVSVRGPAATAERVDRRGGEDSALVLAVGLPGWSGVDLLGPDPVNSGDPAWWLPSDTPWVWCDEEAWDAVRIEAGVPLGGREVTESTIAAEAGLVDRTVSFTKGCFTGQELVARLDSRGSNVARRLCGIVIPSVEPPPVGAAVWTADGAHEVGTLTSVAWSIGLVAFVALATLHRRVTPPEAVEVRWEGGPDGYRVAAEARPSPLVDEG